ncbi:clarin-1 isoform X2 [Calypte anna]|uniref:clarin-1 isoform X2 n=1 Tax=Calypte anna TaxID=9244 RepID=UPI0011C43D70|nr:clarin-1 isoform X2 [Calypte anna]
MPAQQKKIIFCIAGVLSFACALGTAAAIGTQLWVKGSILCKTGALLVNATSQEMHKFIGHIQYGLFHGERVRQCGLGGRPLQFSLLVVFALVGAGFFMLNAFGSPYETLHGPVGLYLWSFISCSCGCLIMILFSSEVKIHHLSEKIANFKEGSFIFKTHSEQFANSFWIILVCSLVQFLNALLIRFAGFEFPFSKSKHSGTTTGAADLMY